MDLYASQAKLLKRPRILAPILIVKFNINFLVVHRKTKLLSREIRGMSRVVGVDWDSLAGLMDVPYAVREEIRLDNRNYPDASSKAEKIFTYFNDSPYFCRYVLQRSIEELDLHCVKAEMLDVKNKVFLMNFIVPAFFNLD